MSEIASAGVGQEDKDVKIGGGPKLLVADNYKKTTKRAGRFFKFANNGVAPMILKRAEKRYLFGN